MNKLTAQLPMPVEDLVAYGELIHEFSFQAGEFFTHLSELVYLYHCMSMTAAFHTGPDKEDDREKLTHWMEDVVSPMINYLIDNQLQNFPEEYVQRELDRRQAFYDSELGKQITGVTNEN